MMMMLLLLRLGNGLPGDNGAGDERGSWGACLLPFVPASCVVVVWRDWVSVGGQGSVCVQAEMMEEMVPRKSEL